LEAENGADALERFCSAEPRVDLVLVDQCMPELDGWEFLKAVRSSE
jgi:CheY-like chemotaxis protein